MVKLSFLVTQILAGSLHGSLASPGKRTQGGVSFYNVMGPPFHLLLCASCWLQH